MACRGCWECLLRLLNFVLMVTGLAMIGYGIYLLVDWTKIAPAPPNGVGGNGVHDAISNLGRPMLTISVAAVANLSEGIIDQLPKAWFIYLFIAVGAIIFIVSTFGCIGAMARNGCCLCCYSFLIIVLILAEVGAACFIFFDHSWKDLIPPDQTGNFDTIYGFLKDNWEITKWVALGAVAFQALLFLLALAVRAANRTPEYDSDDDIIITRSAGLRQPLMHRPPVPATGVPVPTLEQRPSRNDAWSQRMREKYGLDTTEFSYNPADPSRYQQTAAPPTTERNQCTIL